MNNLSSYSEFSKGITEKKPRVSPIAPLKRESAAPLEKETKYVSKHDRVFNSPKGHELIDENEDMAPFKEAYEVVEKEYVALLRELNRVESKNPKLKKDVTELKKNFNDLLVKLQYMAEYVETGDVGENATTEQTTARY